jgi:hypothetical protein
MVRMMFAAALAVLVLSGSVFAADSPDVTKMKTQVKQLDQAQTGELKQIQAQYEAAVKANPGAKAQLTQQMYAAKKAVRAKYGNQIKSLKNRIHAAGKTPRHTKTTRHPKTTGKHTKGPKTTGKTKGPKTTGKKK